MTRIVFLASGNGGTVKFIQSAILKLNLPWKIVALLSDRNCHAVDFAKLMNVESFVFENWNHRIDEVNACLSKFNADIVVTNIHKILYKSTLECTKARFVNLHYSLLPAYGGVIGFKTLELAKENQTRIIGATAHLVDENLDGGTILCQGAFAVDWDKHEMEQIGDKVFRVACMTFLNALFSMVNDAVEQNTKCMDSGVLYSPSLNFETDEFDELFWQQIKNL